MSQFLCSGGDKKMAESKGSLLAKSVSKHAGRAKEKVIKIIVCSKLINYNYVLFYFDVYIFHNLLIVIVF